MEYKLVKKAELDAFVAGAWGPNAWCVKVQVRYIRPETGVGVYYYLFEVEITRSAWSSQHAFVTTTTTHKFKIDAREIAPPKKEDKS